MNLTPEQLKELNELSLQEKTDIIRKIFKEYPEIQNDPELIKFYKKHGFTKTQQFKNLINKTTNS